MPGMHADHVQPVLLHNARQSSRFPPARATAVLRLEHSAFPRYKRFQERYVCRVRRFSAPLLRKIPSGLARVRKPLGLTATALTGRHPAASGVASAKRAEAAGSAVPQAAPQPCGSGSCSPQEPTDSHSNADHVFLKANLFQRRGRAAAPEDRAASAGL